jgi:hypothetical protein
LFVGAEIFGALFIGIGGSQELVDLQKAWITEISNNKEHPDLKIPEDDQKDDLEG